jgi:hypothetical protein
MRKDALSLSQCQQEDTTLIYEDKLNLQQLTWVSYYDPKRFKLLKTLTISIKHGESMPRLEIFVPTTARSSTP